jgi:aminoglycoside phosphotransferase (APT) family kinase protein
MDKDLGKPIALGRTAEIYAWENGQILKLFFDWFELGDIEFEQRMNRAVHASGLPVPAPGEILQVNGRNGLVYERVDGIAMWDVLQKHPLQLFRFARQVADLHAEMHDNTTRPDIPLQRRRLEWKLNNAELSTGSSRRRLPAALKEAALSALAALPDGQSICHGDFHPGNILITPSRAVVIDWIDASLGNPLADVARTSIIFLGAANSSLIQNVALKHMLRLFHALYLRRYFQLRPGGKDEYRRWLPIVAAARLSENIKEIEPWLVAQAQKSFGTM